MAAILEKCIAIMHPIKAHILCSRRRILGAITCLWPASLACALPTLIYNTNKKPNPRFPFKLCFIQFPEKSHYMIYKYLEFFLFFLVPVILQVALYTVMGRRLFGSGNLRRNVTNARLINGTAKDTDAIKARKGVVKMLIASVLVYFISYLPPQVPLIYNTFSSRPFKTNWHFHALMISMGFINSAANPIFYAIFSQKFRRKFGQVLMQCVPKPSRCCLPSQGDTGNDPGAGSSNPSLTGRNNVRFTSLQVSPKSGITLTTM